MAITSEAIHLGSILDKWFWVTGDLIIREAATSRKIREISLDPHLRDPFLKALKLKDELDYVDVMRAFGVINGLEADHLRLHWYPFALPPDDHTKPLEKKWPSRAWWKHSQPIVDTIRDGMITAFEHAQPHCLPIDYYWVITKSATTPVQSFVLDQPHAIILLRVTPEPPSPSTYDRSIIYGVLENFDNYIQNILELEILALSKGGDPIQPINSFVDIFFDPKATLEGDLLPSQNTKGPAQDSKAIKKVFMDYASKFKAAPLEKGVLLEYHHPQIASNQAHRLLKYTPAVGSNAQEFVNLQIFTFASSPTATSYPLISKMESYVYTDPKILQDAQPV